MESHSNNLLIGTNYVYESNDNGRTLRLLNGGPILKDPFTGEYEPSPLANIGKVNAMVYGGRQPDGAVGFWDFADVIYVGTDPGGTPDHLPPVASMRALWVRQAGEGIFSPLVAVESFKDKTTAAVKGVAVDPDDWRSVYVLDADRRDRRAC